jgi:putative transcriptional regulator
MSSVLAPGLLVAAPPLGDPNFDRSVVLLASHDSEGAFGWVINGRLLMSLSELIKKAGLSNERVEIPGVVRAGGPVSPEQAWLLYPSEQRFADLDGQSEVAPGIIATASRAVLQAVVAGQAPEGLITLAGYAGWSPWQLEDEIKRGAWLPTDVTASVVFETPSSELWTRAYERVGATPMSFTTRTVGLA